MTPTEIEEVIELLQPINYDSFNIGYFVLKNGNDMGNPDYCENCIGSAVKEARKYHKEQREKIKAKFELIETKGYCFHNGKKVQVKGKYTNKQILHSKRAQLKNYSSKAVFSYSGHDPDFAGGLTQPCSCENCGEYFTCNFVPDKYEAEYLLQIANHAEPLTDRDKWEIEIALINYDYANPEVKLLLLKVAKNLKLKLCQ